MQVKFLCKCGHKEEEHNHFFIHASAFCSICNYAFFHTGISKCIEYQRDNIKYLESKYIESLH